MSIFIVDVEADGPAPGLYSMVSFGVVKVDDPIVHTFYGEVRPISDQWIPDALAVSHVTREEHLTYRDPKLVMPEMVQWVHDHNDGHDRPIFMSDNPAFDWQFINYYCHAYAGGNPFGHSARRIGDFYSGLVKNFRASNQWKKLRQTRHTHDPVDDARGNAEALITMSKKFKVPLK